MKNTRLKGNRIQRKLMFYLEGKGWLVSTAEVGGRFVKEKDMFGLYDLVCIKPGIVLFVQVTCNRPHTHYKYQDFCDKYANDSIWIEQWVWYDYKGFKQIIYYPNNEKKINKVETY